MYNQNIKGLIIEEDFEEILDTITTVVGWASSMVKHGYM
jgi:hypothetical protein